MQLDLKTISAVVGIVVGITTIAGAATLYNPFVLKSDYDPVITLIGGDRVLDWQLRRDALEQDKWAVEDVAKQELQRDKRVSETTRQRLLNIKSQINSIDAKIKQYEEALEKD